VGAQEKEEKEKEQIRSDYLNCISGIINHAVTNYFVIMKIENYSKYKHNIF
jgi:hypothetical protein